MVSKIIFNLKLPNHGKGACEGIDTISMRWNQKKNKNKNKNKQTNKQTKKKQQQQQNNYMEKEDTI